METRGPVGCADLSRGCLATQASQGVSEPSFQSISSGNIHMSPQNCKNKDIHRSIIYNTKKNPVNSPQVHEKGCFHKLWENYMIEYCYHFNYLICMFFVKIYIFWLCVFMWNTYNFSGKMSCEKFWFQKTDYTCLKTLYVDIWSACICVAETNYGSLWVHTCQEAPFPFLANLSTLTF